MLYSTLKRQANSQIFDILIYSTEILSTFIYPTLCKKESWDIIWIFVYLGFVSVILIHVMWNNRYFGNKWTYNNIVIYRSRYVYKYV